MAYTIGASHGPFTGNGSFAVSKPNGIRTVVTGIPFYTGHDGSIPRRYFRLGRFTMGNADGFQFSHGLEYVQQLLYPMPPVWEILAYDVKDGASCTFYELVDVPDLSLKQPWDRTPLHVGGAAQPVVSGANGWTTVISYTVPVGRRLVLSHFMGQFERMAAATAAGLSMAIMSAGGNPIANMYTSQNVVGRIWEGGLRAGPLYLPPSATIDVVHWSSDTGGTRQYNFSWAGLLFDA